MDGPRNPGVHVTVNLKRYEWASIRLSIERARERQRVRDTQDRMREAVKSTDLAA